MDDLSISVVSPVYKAEGIVTELVTRIEKAISSISSNYEIILVDDGSPDNSWERIEEICNCNANVKGVQLSRNFGQHQAVTAGLSKAKGDIVILIDCDLQDDPEDIKSLWNKMKEGYDVVFTNRIARKHSFFKSLGSKAFNSFFIFLADSKYNVNVGSLTLITKAVKDNFLLLKDQDRLYVQLIKWVGFKQTYVDVVHQERFIGQSSYSFLALLKLAFQGITFHSDKLLRYSIYLGFFFAFSSFLSILYIVYMYFDRGYQSGWASMIVTLLFCTGVLLVSIGILGIYLGKVFEQSKNRPLYIISKEENIE